MFNVKHINVVDHFSISDRTCIRQYGYIPIHSLAPLSMVQMVQTKGEHLLFKIILCEVTLVCLVFFSVFQVLKKKQQIFIQWALNLLIYVNLKLFMQFVKYCNDTVFFSLLKYISTILS